LLFFVLTVIPLLFIRNFYLNKKRSRGALIRLEYKSSFLKTKNVLSVNSILKMIIMIIKSI
jgi:hypothetical protein